MAMSGLTPAAKPITRTAIPSNGHRLIAARYRAGAHLASRERPARRSQVSARPVPLSVRRPKMAPPVARE
jgi:hypothetical protein